MGNLSFLKIIIVLWDSQDLVWSFEFKTMM